MYMYIYLYLYIYIYIYIYIYTSFAKAKKKKNQEEPHGLRKSLKTKRGAHRDAAAISDFPIPNSNYWPTRNSRAPSRVASPYWRRCCRAAPSRTRKWASPWPCGIRRKKDKKVTHTHQQRTTPPTLTHTRNDTNNTPNPQTNTFQKHLTTLEGGATVRGPVVKGWVFKQWLHSLMIYDETQTPNQRSTKLEIKLEIAFRLSHSETGVSFAL